MAHGPAAPEVEAKLIVPTDGQFRALARLERLGSCRLRRRASVRLHSIYVDTRRLTLARHGVALRLRRCGRRWEATAKWAGRVEGAVHERPELTRPLRAAPGLPLVLPDGPLRRHLSALVAGRPLHPILITDIHRRRFDVLPPASRTGAGPLAELALDRVRLRAPARSRGGATYCEVEVERRRGTRREIARLARQLQRRFSLRPSSDSKFSRGLSLLYGPDRLEVRAPLGAAARTLAARHQRVLRAHDRAVHEADAASLQDPRVAARRLLAALDAFGAGLPARERARVNTERQWLTRRLARARRRAELLAVLGSPRYFRLLIRLEGLAFGRRIR